MLGRIVVGKRSRDEGEKPFWISFSDMMTALMVLFMVVMVVSLLSVTQKLRDVQQDEVDRSAAIDRMVETLKEAAKNHAGVEVIGNGDRVTVDFGDAARFALNDYSINDAGADRLRHFIPEVLAMADSDDGKRWFKRVIVEGFTDPRGTYLHNLHLSLMRAESVLCTMLDSNGSVNLTEAQKQAVRRLFLVGGFSSNSTRGSNEESRRVELRLDFRAVKEKPQQETLNEIPLGKCRI